jgi:lysozyme
MTYSDECVALTKMFEGCRLTAYSDQGGVLTIGYGHTGLDVFEGRIISQLRADRLLTTDLNNAAFHVQQLITVPLTQFQFDAVTDFTFNLGYQNLKTSHLRIFILAGNMERAAAEFLQWDHVNGVVVPGLLARRKAEMAMFEGKQW